MILPAPPAAGHNQAIHVDISLITFWRIILYWSDHSVSIPLVCTCHESSMILRRVKLSQFGCMGQQPHLIKQFGVCNDYNFMYSI